jgi:hypothetical protein
MLLLLPLLLLLLLLRGAAGACTGPASCTYAGACVAGACVCAPGFAGPACALFANSSAIPLASGFRLPDHHVWGAQVAFDGADGLYHMAASVYPAGLPFLSSWLYTASIATARAAQPLGPYALDVLPALPQGGEGAWDRNVMNPKLLRAPGERSLWLLYYTGNAYGGPTPAAGGAPLPKNQSLAQASQQLGLATAPSPAGPFARRGAPVLSPRPGQWDARIISNVAVAPFGDGNTSLLAVYKSSSPAGAGSAQTRVCLGAAYAPRWDAPFTRLSSDPILPCPEDTFYAEDPTLWRGPDGTFHLVFKDFVGHWTHAGYSGAHATSADEGRTWVMADPPLAYTTTHAWADGRVRTQHAQERVQVLLSDAGSGGDGGPLAVFYATDTELDGSRNKTWCMAVPAR